ncbi:ATP-binding protein [Phaeodactylibacter xiamenensis]|uniref:ATP-binding protein n=1 Tax=Phaeodactylibacter xiamenensis TaxID=1524460 RepID=UPI0024A8984E|nr:ATP-binding protein [Phaeodactylibacter xiamenensis]
MRSRLKISFAIAVLLPYLLGGGSLSAQGPLSESTLPLPTQRLIWDMATGPEGYLWLATKLGLFRYDGHRYVAYTDAQGTPNRISYNDVMQVLPTQDGQLALFNGVHTVDVLNPATNALKTHDIGAGTSPRGAIRTACRQADGRVFFITEHDEGYALFEYLDGAFERCFERREKRLTNPKMTAQGSRRFHLAAQEDGSFLLHDQENGLLHLSNDGQMLRRFSPTRRKNKALNFFQAEKQGGIILAYDAKSGIYRADLASGAIERDPRFPDDYYSICKADEHGNLLFGAKERSSTIKSLWMLDPEGNFTEIEDLSSRPPFGFLVYGRNFSDFFYLVSDSGLLKINTRERNVKSYLAKMDISGRGMMSDGQGGLIITTERHGWYRLDRASDRISPIQIGDTGYPDLDPPQYPRNLIKDTNGDIWASAYGNPPVTATPDGYLLRYRPSDGSVRAFKNKYRIEALLPDKSGMFYIASIGTLQKFDPATGQFAELPGNYGFSFTQGVIPNCIMQARDGKIWIGTEKGLVQFDPEDSSFVSFGDEGNRPAPFSNNIMAIHEAPDGRLWLGTQGGLHLFDAPTGQVETYTDRNGLPDNNVCAILPDEHGNIWLATFKGLSYFEPRAKRFRNFYTSEGFNHNEFNRHSFYRTEEGTYFIGGMDGFNAFRAEELMAEKVVPGILLSEIAFFGPRGDSLITRTHGLSKLHSIVLPAANRFLQLRFALDHFSHPEQNSYSVFLEGYDADWVSLGNVAEVRYNNLPPGKYRLHVRGAGPSGTLSKNTIELNVHVKQFFYKSAWFYLLLLLAGMALIAAWISRLRTEKLRLKAEVEKRTAQIWADKEIIEQQASELQELDRIKSQFFANISHELRTPLTLILSPLKRILKNESLNLPAIRQHLEIMEKNGELLRLQIEELLELSRLDAGKAALQRSLVELKPLLQNTLERFEPAAAQKGIDLVLDWQLPEMPTVLLDAPKFEKIISNLIDNALKFTASGRVQLTVSGQATAQQNKQVLQLCAAVTDTGRGITPEDLPHVFERYFQTRNDVLATAGSGIGLALAKSFAVLMGGDITVESRMGEGSTFTCRLPLPLSEPKASKSSSSSSPEKSLKEAAEPIVYQLPTATNAAGQAAEQATILLAEDNHDLRYYLQQILEAHYEVAAVENGQQALQYLQSESPVQNLLILSDVMMPVMDGFTLLESVKAEEKLRKVPFVMLTAKAGSENRLRALRMGVDDYLLKPFEEEELLARIANLLSNLRLRLQFAAEDQVPEPNEGAAEQEWLETVEKIALTSLNDPQLSIDFLAKKTGLSRSSFHRRIKAETGLTPNLYLREIRLQQARQLLEGGLVASVAEAARQVGIQKRAYFSQLFQSRFGRLPSSYFQHPE